VFEPAPDTVKNNGLKIRAFSFAKNYEDQNGARFWGSMSLGKNRESSKEKTI
jgi:hypothetical protein